MGYTVIARPGAVLVGAYGAAENACTDIGSVKKVTLTYTQDEEVATDSSLGDAVSDVDLGGTKGVLEIDAEYITRANLAYAVAGTVQSNDVRILGASGRPSFYTIYVHGPVVEGTASTLHVYKAYIKPDADFGMDKTQQILTLKFTLMGDGNTNGIALFTPATTYSSAPTIASSAPTDGQTLAAPASYVWTFTSTTNFGPLRSDTVTADNFYLYKDTDGTPKAGTLSLDATGYIVTFTPTTAFSGGTAYRAAVGTGVKSVNGTAMAPPSVRKFTTS